MQVEVWTNLLNEFVGYAIIDYRKGYAEKIGKVWQTKKEAEKILKRLLK